MRFYDRDLARIADDDPPAMKEAIRALQKEKFGATRPDRYQLKIGRINFYPTKSRITSDGAAGSRKIGLEGLLALLRRQRGPRDTDPRPSGGSLQTPAQMDDVVEDRLRRRP